MLVLAVTATGASAATVHVETAGIDQAGCGVSNVPATDACGSIAYAVNSRAADGDTVQIGAGTFPLTENATITNKDLTIVGAGAGSDPLTDTIVDGENATTLTAAGMFRINASASGRTVSISDLSVINVAKQSTGTSAWAVYTSASLNAVDVNVTDVNVEGRAPATTPNVIAVGSDASSGTLHVDGLDYSKGSGNALLLERHTGNVLVENSSFEQGPGTTPTTEDTDALIYSYTWGGNAYNITGDYTFRNNSFRSRFTIAINAGFSALTPASILGKVSFEDNDVHVNESSNNPVRFENVPQNASTPTTATFDRLEVKGNTFTAADRTARALQIRGRVNNASVTGNVVRGFTPGIELANSAVRAAEAPSGAVLSGNQIVDNRFNSGQPKYGLTLGSNVTNVTANGNWWGCNAGPPIVVTGTAAALCDAVRLANSGQASEVTLSNWLVLKFTASPYPTLGWQDSSALTLDLTELNTGNPAPQIFPDGTAFPVTTTMGNVDDSPLLLAGSEATTNFNSDWRKNRSAAVTLDNQTVTLNWTDDPTPLTIHVETPGNGGVDSPTCGPLPHNPCATIAYAVNNQAIDGDTVEIGEGTFPLTSNAAITAKGLTVVGQGKDQTIIDGENANTLASGGMFRLTGSGSGKTVSFSDFSVINVATAGSATTAFAILVNGGHQTLGMNVNVTDVRVSGRAPATTPDVVAVDSGANRGALHVDGLEYVNGSGNAILLERHEGPALVENSSFTQGASEADLAIFDYSYGGATYNVTGDHVFRNNTINAANGIYVNAGFSYLQTLVPSSYLGEVVFEGNTFNSRSNSTVGVMVANTPAAQPSPPNPLTSPATIDNVRISGNTFVGAGSGNAVNFFGKVDDALLEQNSIRGYVEGIRLTSSPVFADDYPSDSTIIANQIVDNGTGVRLTATGHAIPTNLSGNWWGCNAGPAIGPAPLDEDCDSITTADASAVTLDDWVVLGLTASVNGELGATASSGLTAGFSKLNTGANAPDVFADGTVLPMSATGGNLATNSPTLTDGQTTNTFTSTANAGRSASASFDHQTVTKTWDDVTYPAVTITSPANNTLTNLSPITLQYTATDAGGGPLNCVPSDGAAIALSPGANAIVVSCTDSDGNVGIDSVAVTYDNTPPTLTIVAPGNGSVTSSANATLVFQTDDEYGPVTCDHSNGQSIPLNEGTNPITVVCEDAAGNQTSKSVTVTRDSTPPAITIGSPADGSTTLEDNVPLDYTWVDATATTCTPTNGTILPLLIGANTFTVTCTDAAGNVGTRTTTITRLSRAPEISISSPANGSTTTDATAELIYTATSPVGAEFTCTPDSGTIVPLNFNSNTITVSCEDEFNLTSSASVTVTRIDTTKPVVTINAPTNGTITKEDSIELDFSVDDDTATTCNLTSGDDVELDLGSNAITVVCTDAFGNVGTASVSVIRDNTPPTVTIVTPPNNTLTNATSIVVNYTANDDYGIASCSQPDGTTVALDEGPNVITVYCTDRAGNVGSGQITVVRDTVAPVVTITSPSDNSSTTDATVSLAYSYVDDGGGVTCTPANNSQVLLDYGPNTITVTCTDAAGNVGTKSISVTRTSDSAPVLSISSPANGSVITGSSTTLVYQAASDHGTVTCDPPSGSTIPLSVGANTITVNCVDSFGNTTSASVTVHHPDSLPACAKDIAITDVQRVGSRTRIRGVARLQYVGQKVKIQYQPTKTKTVGQAVVRADGSWSIVVKRPARPKYTANNARYRAVLATTTTSYVKVTRRMSGTAVTYDGNGRLVVSGSATKPLVKGARVRVMRSDQCGAYRQVGTLAVRKNGTFGGSVGSGGPGESAAYIRLTLKVAKDKRARSKFNTYSIVQPVVIER